MLERELQRFEELRAELEEHHMGKWVLIHEDVFIGAFETFEGAATEAVRQFGRGPYLIRQVGAPEPVLPTSVMYFPTNAAL